MGWDRAAVVGFYKGESGSKAFKIFIDGNFLYYLGFF